MPANQFLSFLISPTSFFFSLSLSLFSLYLAAVDIEEEDGCAVRGYYLDDRVPFLQQPEKLLLESGFFFSFLFFFFYYDEYRKGNKEERGFNMSFFDRPGESFTFTLERRKK